MDAVDERRFFPLDVARRGLVRREHELLDDLVRHVPFGPEDVGHAALEVEHDLGLGQIEVDAAPFRPLRAQDRHELFHEPEFVEQCGVALPLPRVAVHEYLAHRGVGHAFVAVDDALVDVVPQDLSFRGDIHLAGEGEPVHVRVQAADAVRERLGKHGDGAVRKVHACAALVGLFIK